MNYLSIITAGVSIGTFLMVIVKFFWDLRQKRIDREINIMIVENRRKQQELFKNVMGILEVHRQIEHEILLKEKSILFHEILSLKVGVWINLNSQNKFKDELRSNCNELVMWVASALETDGVESQKKYTDISIKNRMQIWILIDKYIDDEESIIKLILKGKKRIA